MPVVERLESLVSESANAVAVSLELITIAVLTIGAAIAVFGIAKGMATTRRDEWQRHVWLRFAGWTLLALEFALAADIVRTAHAPDWDSIGKLAVIAVVRTILNFFLGRDLDAVKAPDREATGNG